MNSEVLAVLTISGWCSCFHLNRKLRDGTHHRIYFLESGTSRNIDDIFLLMSSRLNFARRPGRTCQRRGPLYCIEIYFFSMYHNQNCGKILPKTSLGERLILFSPSQKWPQKIRFVMGSFVGRYEWLLCRRECNIVLRILLATCFWDTLYLKRFS